MLKVRRKSGRAKSGRAILFMISIVLLTFICFLNLMVQQLSSADFISNEKTDEIKLDVDQQFPSNRKPKAAIEKSVNDIDSNKNYQTIKKFRFKSHTNIPDEDKEDESDDNEEEYPDDDITDVVIEDDDTDDDNDDDDPDLTLKAKPDLKVHHIFEPNDFHNLSKLIFAKPMLQYQEILNIQEKFEEKAGPSAFMIPDSFAVYDGIYWAADVERLLPKGFSDEEAFNYTKTIRLQHVDSVHAPTWNRCGRPKNAFIVLEDKKEMCARYRDGNIKLVLGEVLSFYLSRLLGMDSVPAVVTSVTTQNGQWTNSSLQKLEWKQNQLVALIQWIPNMETFRSYVRIPDRILKAYHSGHPIQSKDLDKISVQDVVELQQWGSLIIFDYLTGNYDRVASMQDAAEEQRKPSIIMENIRNLHKSTKTAKLWLIDNESGLLDAYDLLYNHALGGDRFLAFHRQMLQTLCVFQKSMVTAIRKLLMTKSPHTSLFDFATSHDPVLKKVLPNYKFELFETMFVQRLQEVYSWIQKCGS